MPADIPLVHIGIVRSPIKDREAMPTEGVTAELEIYPAYAPALASPSGDEIAVLLSYLGRRPDFR